MPLFNSSRTVVVVAGAVAAFAAGCGNKPSATTGDGLGSGTRPAAAAVQIPGVDRTQAAREGVTSLRDALAAQKAQVDRTSATLMEVMQGQGELVPSFQKYTLSIADAKAARDRVQQQVEAMRARARDYITGWEVEVYGVDDPELRRQAETRRNAVRANYSRINETVKASGAAYAQYETAASDLQRFLANDLTKSGVTAAATAAQKATQAGVELKARIDAATTELDRVAGEMTPAGTATGGSAGTGR
ncbi:MAG: hypothetical protein JWO31_3823 [Phycisphaerales bacterium]|nr:hypothetical protein [Phycisphaerales bacterium]